MARRPETEVGPGDLTPVVLVNNFFEELEARVAN
jgi:hypothetical protein